MHALAMDQRGHGDGDKPAQGYALLGFRRGRRGVHGRSKEPEWAAPFADEVDRLTDPVDRGWVKASLEWFPTFHDIPQWYIEDRVDDGVRMPAHVWHDALAGLATARPPTETGTIRALTLIIWGGRDELLQWEEQESLSAKIPGSRVVVYADTGHLVLWEQPELVAADLKTFVESLPA